MPLIYPSAEKEVVLPMVVLSKSEKRVICIEFAHHLPKIRDLLHLTQREFGAVCGISVDRLSRIENEHAVMTWCQLTSILMICMMNLDTKEYLFANRVLPIDLFRYFQQKDANIPPLLNICVSEETANQYIYQNKEMI